MPSHAAYREIFREAHGDGPWSCFGCGEPVTLDGLVVHHIDLNHANDVIENLAPMHLGCHSRLHMTGVKLSETIKVRMSEAQKGRPRPRTKEHSLKIGATKRGIPLSEPHKQRLREARLRQPRFACVTCQYTNIAPNVHHHLIKSGHEGKIRL